MIISQSYCNHSHNNSYDSDLRSMSNEDYNDLECLRRLDFGDFENNNKDIWLSDIVIALSKLLKEEPCS